MKNKILVIFFISFLFSSIIYKFTLSNNKYILILGDNYFKSSYNKDYIYETGAVYWDEPEFEGSERP